MELYCVNCIVTEAMNYRSCTMELPIKNLFCHHSTILIYVKYIVMLNILTDTNLYLLKENKILKFNILVMLLYI